jgi:hypothetical protein
MTTEAGKRLLDIGPWDYPRLDMAEWVRAIEKEAAQIDRDRLMRAFCTAIDASFVSDGLIDTVVAAYEVDGAIKATGGPMSPDWNANGTAIVGESGAE